MRHSLAPIRTHRHGVLGEAGRCDCHAYRHELGNARGGCGAADRGAVSLYHL